jgi:hypothetical protein
LTDPHTNRRLRGDDLAELSDEDVEARIAGLGRTRAVARPVRGRRTQARQRGVSSRDTFLLLAFVVVASLALKLFWTSEPASAVSTPSPASDGVALAATGALRTLGPGETLKPGETLGPVAPSLDANASATPQPVATPSLVPTPTRGPGATPRPTAVPQPTRTPSPTPVGTPVGTPTTATLTVYLRVVNNSGGTHVPVDWTVTMLGGGASPSTFAGSSLGVKVRIAPGQPYTVSDIGPAGYDTSISGSCSYSTQMTLTAGASASCTIIHDDRSAHVLVKLHVVNDDDPSSTVSAGDWTVTVTGGSATPSSFTGLESGTNVAVKGGAAYTVEDPTGPSGYVLSKTLSCSGTLQIGQSTTCTLTEDDVAPAPTPSGFIPWLAPFWINRRRHVEGLRP